MFNFLAPYVMWVKLALIAAALAGSAYMGHEWTRRGYEADKARDISTAAAKYEESVKAGQAEAARLTTINDWTSASYNMRLQQLATDNQKLQRNIKNATSNQPACTFTAGYQWVWNDSIKRANGNGVPAGVADTGGTESSNAAPTRIDRGTLLTNHDALMQACGKYKAQLDAILEADKKAHTK